MPLYEYHCTACGKSTEILQKLSEPPHTECPFCSKNTLTKQISSPSFQLKGSGWYVTDFREKKTPTPSAVEKTESTPPPSEKKTESSDT